jgi:iron complex outermembrane receptor protein
MNTKHYYGAASPAVLAAALLLVPALAQAQDTPPAAPATDEVAQVETVVVTGSRLASRGFSAPTPVAVKDAEEFKLSGTVNPEQLLGNSPQFVGSQNNGATANTVPGGTATLNLRGFGAQRNLVLVNGRRFAIAGADQTTDINTIPAALIKRTEVVTGGSSAVYGSDAITGVVNFIMRDDFEGVEIGGQTNWDSHTTTPTYDLNLTAGGNFAQGRGNAVVSINYLDRGAISRGQRGDWAYDSLSDGCVTSASFSKSKAGIPLAVPGGSTCSAAGGRMGLIAGGSGDIPNGRFTGVPTVGGAGSTPGLDAALIAAGLGSMGSRGFTFDNAGTTARPALTPQDDFNLGPDNYLIIPQKRWMLNAFSHYDFNSKMTGYLEGHFSNNVVDMQLAPTNINGLFLLNTNNPYLATPMQEVLRQMDLKETGTTTVTTGTSSRTTVAGDGLAVINVGRRLKEIGLRRNNAERNVWRMAAGLRGDLGSVSDNFLRNLSYDAYYTYARTSETDHQEGNASRSRFQAALLSVGGAAPVLNLFGQNISPAGVSAISIAATNITEAEQQVASASLSGELFSLPAGPVDFSTGTEWRYNSARYIPDEFLRSGDVVGFNPGLPTGGSTIVKEVYGEARVPILADLPFVKNLSANGAFRYSDYNLKGVGGVWTYSVGGAWAVTSDVNFRGQFQHAIRAPNVGELYGGLAQSFDAATDPCSSRAPAAQQTAAVRAVCVATGVPAAAVFTPGVQSNTIIGNLTGRQSERRHREVGHLHVRRGHHAARPSGSGRQRRLLQHRPGRRHLGPGRRAEQHAEPLLQHRPERLERVLPGDQAQPGHRRDRAALLRDDHQRQHRRPEDGRRRLRGQLPVQRRLRHAAPEPGQPLRDRHGMDLDRRVHLDARPGLPEHQELLRRRVRPDLRPADPRMEGRHAGDLADWSADPQRAPPLCRRGRDRQVHPAQARGRHGSGPGPP